jgi:hypothetical protein
VFTFVETLKLKIMPIKEKSKKALTKVKNASPSKVKKNEPYSHESLLAKQPYMASRSSISKLNPNSKIERYMPIKETTSQETLLRKMGGNKQAANLKVHRFKNKKKYSDLDYKFIVR